MAVRTTEYADDVCIVGNIDEEKMGEDNKYIYKMGYENQSK